MGTRSTPAPLAQRRGNDSYMDTRSEKYDKGTNVVHTINFFKLN